MIINATIQTINASSTKEKVKLGEEEEEVEEEDEEEEEEEDVAVETTLLDTNINSNISR
jgi:hypothetical protein